jgi:PHP family Zn ribbon phosphoesterase
LTIGVAHRVEQLADRSAQEVTSSSQPFQYILPLPELLAEIMEISDTSKAVKKKYTQAISYFGNEFDALLQAPLEDIHRFHPTLSIAIERLRKDEKHFTAGYDGEHGRVCFFEDGELHRKAEQIALF